MQLHHALPPKQPARQAPVDAAHADRHHRPPANPSGLAGSNCDESAVPATEGADAAGLASRGFGGWPRGECRRCMHFTGILHAYHGGQVSAENRLGDGMPLTCSGCNVLRRRQAKLLYRLSSRSVQTSQKTGHSWSSCQGDQSKSPRAAQSRLQVV